MSTNSFSDKNEYSKIYLFYKKIEYVIFDIPYENLTAINFNG